MKLPTVPAGLAGKIVKNRPLSNQSDCRIWRIPPARKLKKKINSDICYLLSFSSTSLVQITVVSPSNLHKRSEALARYYVTSYWQAEWVKKLRWKTIELPSPLTSTKGLSKSFIPGSDIGTSTETN